MLQLAQHGEAADPRIENANWSSVRHRRQDISPPPPSPATTATEAG